MSRRKLYSNVCLLLTAYDVSLVSSLFGIPFTTSVDSLEVYNCTSTKRYITKKLPMLARIYRQEIINDTNVQDHDAFKHS